MLGRLGARLGNDVVYPEAGDLAFKPREQWHTFWNAGDGPCRILEIISPAGFEHSFDELAAGVGSPEDYQARYGTQVNLDRTRRLCEQHGLVFRSTSDRSTRQPCWSTTSTEWTPPPKFHGTRWVLACLGGHSHSHSTGHNSNQLDRTGRNLAPT